jgi:RNA polymerase sigma factor (sigma-70 family)
MTKEGLKEYEDLLMEVKELEQETEEIRTQINALVINNYTEDLNCSKQKEKLLTSMEALYTALLYKKEKAVKTRLDIEQAIDVLPARERRIIRSYYIYGKLWEDIANEMGYSIQHIWRLHSNILKKLRDNES